MNILQRVVVTASFALMTFLVVSKSQVSCGFGCSHPSGGTLPTLKMFPKKFSPVMGVTDLDEAQPSFPAGTGFLPLSIRHVGGRSARLPRYLELAIRQLTNIGRDT